MQFCDRVIDFGLFQQESGGYRFYSMRKYYKKKRFASIGHWRLILAKKSQNRLSLM
jgi:hypothetical protein